jgi:capsular exopolysaccharide synthesis family protein
MDRPVENVATANRALSPGEGSKELDLRRYWSAFRKYSGTFIVLFLLFLALVVGASFVLPPRYTATAQVVIDTRMQAAVDVRTGTPSPTQTRPADPTAIDSEVEVLRSRALAEQVAAKLGLDKGANKDSVEYANLVANLMAGLKVQRSGLTSLINVQYTAPSPNVAARYANTFAEVYIDQTATEKGLATGKAGDVLSGRLAELRAEAEKTDAALQQYKISHGLLSADGASLTEQEIIQLNLDLARNRNAEAEAVARLNAARAQLASGGKGEDVAAALSSDTIENLRNQRSQVARQLADLSTRYGPKHPSVLQQQQQLQVVDKQIAEEVERIMSNLQAQVQIARDRTRSSEASVAASRQRLAANGQASVGLNELQRNADAAKAIYESFLTRYKETEGAKGLEQSDARILAPALPPDHASFPNRPLMAALGVVLGLSVGAGGVVLRNLLDAGLSTAEQVESFLGVRFLGTVPLIDKKAAARSEVSRFVIEKPISAYSDSLRNLRASIGFSRPGTDVRVIALTSALPAEGKTSTAIGLARSTALSGASCVLIDCDVRRASSGRALGLTSDLGLVEFLRGEATLEQVLQKDPLTDAYFLPIAKPRPDADDLVSSQTMRNLIADLRKRFQYIYLDTAPVLAVADTRMLSTMADVTVVLVHWRTTPRKATEAALGQLDHVGSYIAGVALTQVDLAEQAKSGYGDASYYYEHYRQYYQD